MKNKNTILLLAALALGALIVVNAAVFTYRWMQGNISVADQTNAEGAACTGFYSSLDQSGINLPEAGTNYNAPTYGNNTISVTPGNVVCQYDYAGNTYYLYESITADLNITIGSWYIKDFYGFGYNGTSTDPAVYVYLKVETPVDTTVVSNAQLIVYKTDGTTTTQVATLDLTTSGATTTAITLNPGEALQLDLNMTATAVGSTSFKVSFYATQTAGEAPR